ncbi:MAG: hypothetical protein HY895_18605 [Deltaproteobacteria bacterium]|nr:hypothetical protein [Deltaproteobacteria bacterium]
MTIAAEYSLIPYEPSGNLSAFRRPGAAAYATGARNPASRRHEPQPAPLLIETPRRSATTYSFHRTIADSRAAATGLRVDIFV